MAKKGNPNPSIAHSVAVIAENIRMQTKILDRMENRQDKINDNIGNVNTNLVKLDTKNDEQHKSIKEKLVNYFRLIFILIAIVAALVGIKLSGVI